MHNPYALVYYFNKNLVEIPNNAIKICLFSLVKLLVFNVELSEAENHIKVTVSISGLLGCDTMQ
jgi:hypothetical protein